MFAELEILLGLWLLVGFRPVLGRVAAMGCFTLFVAMNVRQIREGSESCGCLGQIEVDPWYVLAFDLAALAALWSWQPRSRQAQPMGFNPVPHETTRRWWRLSVAILLTAVGFLAGAVVLRHTMLSASELARSIEIDHLTHDFGDADQAQSLTHSFTLRNVGEKPIEFTLVHSTCGCATTEDIVGRVLQPGQSLEVKTELRTGDYDGLRTARLLVYYRIPAERGSAYIPFDLSANVITDYWVRPTLVDFGEISDSKPRTRTVRLRPNRMRDVRIERLESADPSISTRLASRPNEEGDLEFDVTFSAAALSRSTPVSATVGIHTNCPCAPLTLVLVQAVFRPPVEAIPSAIIVPSGQSGKRRHEIQLRSSRPIQHAGVSCSVRGANSEVMTTSTGQFDRIIVELPPDDGKALSGQVKIDVRCLGVQGALEAHSLSVPIERFPAPRKDP